MRPTTEAELQQQRVDEANFVFAFWPASRRQGTSSRRACLGPGFATAHRRVRYWNQTVFCRLLPGGHRQCHPRQKCCPGCDSVAAGLSVSVCMALATVSHSSSEQPRSGERGVDNRKKHGGPYSRESRIRESAMLILKTPQGRVRRRRRRLSVDGNLALLSFFDSPLAVDGSWGLLVACWAPCQQRNACRRAMPAETPDADPFLAQARQERLGHVVTDEGANSTAELRSHLTERTTDAHTCIASERCSPERAFGTFPTWLCVVGGVLRTCQDGHVDWSHAPLRLGRLQTREPRHRGKLAPDEPLPPLSTRGRGRARVTTVPLRCARLQRHAPPARREMAWSLAWAGSEPEPSAPTSKNNGQGGVRNWSLHQTARAHRRGGAARGPDEVAPRSTQPHLVSQLRSIESGDWLGECQGAESALPG